MQNLIDSLTNSLTFSHWGYYILFLAIFCEAIFPFGMIIPGQTLVIIAGFFVKMGTFKTLPLFIITILAASLGDMIGYILGKFLGLPFFNKYGKYFFLKKQNLEKVENFLHKHTGKSLIIGRLNSFTRALAPFAAGVTKISFIKFSIFTFLGAILWSAAFILVGYLFGQSYEVAEKFIGKFIFIAIALSITIIYTYRFIQQKKHIFAKYHLYDLTLNIVSLYVFSKMAEGVSNNNIVIVADNWINRHMLFIQSAVLNNIMIFITNIGNEINLSILSVGLFTGLILAKKYYNSILLFFAMAGGLALEEIFKILISRPRPENALLEVGGFSFPSGHTTMSVIFFSLLLYSFKNDFKKNIYKNIFILANITLFVLIGFSRLYLNVHWFSDVIGGAALGLFWLTLLILIFKITIYFVKSYKTEVLNK